MRAQRRRRRRLRCRARNLFIELNEFLDLVCRNQCGDCGDDEEMGHAGDTEESDILMHHSKQELVAMLMEARLLALSASQNVEQDSTAQDQKNEEVDNTKDADKNV